MAKSQPQEKAKSFHKYQHEVFGIVFIFLGAFSLLSLLTYQHSDPSLFTRSSHHTANYGGIVGANLSEILIQFAGLSSFIFCVLCFSFAARLFQGIGLSKIVNNGLWILIAILSGSTLLSLQVSPIDYGGVQIPAGGVFGGWLAKMLKNIMALWGATLFTSALLMISLVFSTPISAAKIFHVGMKVLYEIFNKTYQFGLQAIEALKHLPVLRDKIAEQKISKALKEKLESKPEIVEPEIVSKPINKPIQKQALTKEEIEFDLEEENESNEISVTDMRQALRKEKQVKPKTAPKSTPVVQGNFTLPPLELLAEPVHIDTQIDKIKLQENSRLLEDKLNQFGVEGNVVAVRPGPVITMYEFKPGPGVRVTQIANLADDLSLALSAKSVRILAPIPGKNVVGIEIPNEQRERVYLREIFSTDEFQNAHAGIPIAIGKDIAGIPATTDLSKMPHLLIAGAPGAGKSVFINSLICSLLYKFTPNDLRLIMVDPKMIELNLYENIPHLLLPIVDDPKKASTALKWAVNEMERRYKIMGRMGVRNITGFNEKLEKEGHEKVVKALCPETADGMPEPNSLAQFLEHDEKGKPRIEHLPYILIIIDEFADLMMVAKQDVETSVLRIAQKARAAGIHLAIATQRPSVDVVTGTIKANLPHRLSFKVATKGDSRTILDANGAEKLLGQGDMLFIPPGLSQLVRLHGAFVTEDEITKICDHWKSQGKPIFKEEILQDNDETSDEMLDGATDELYQEAITFVRETGHASASMLQRRFKVGYNRAARMVDAMEAQGVVGPAEGSKPREVLY